MGSEFEHDIKRYICKSETNDNINYNEVVESYIMYYHFKARRCKIWCYTLSGLKYLLLGLLPFFQVWELTEQKAWIIVLCSSAVFFIESFSELCRLKEKWILSRNTCNKLLSVQRQFIGGRGRDCNSEEMQYIRIVENVIGEEAKEWAEISKSVKKRDGSAK